MAWIIGQKVNEVTTDQLGLFCKQTFFFTSEKHCSSLTNPKASTLHVPSYAVVDSQQMMLVWLHRDQLAPLPPAGYNSDHHQWKQAAQDSPADPGTMSND